MLLSFAFYPILLVLLVLDSKEILMVLLLVQFTYLLFVSCCLGMHRLVWSKLNMPSLATFWEVGLCCITEPTEWNVGLCITAEKNILFYFFQSGGVMNLAVIISMLSFQIMNCLLWSILQGQQLTSPWWIYEFNQQPAPFITEFTFRWWSISLSTFQGTKAVGVLTPIPLWLGLGRPGSEGPVR